MEPLSLDILNNQEKALGRPTVFSVAQFNLLVKEVIEEGFPNAIWICGEIQGYDRNKDKKHVFFELCEKDPESHEIMARIGLVLFAGRKPYVEEMLRRAETSFELKDDIEVKFLCRVDFYPPHGALRLIVETIDPVYTLGRIAQDRQRLIQLLKKKGILEKNKTLTLSALPLHIGLITSFDSAAYNDFISELKRSGFGFKVFFINSLMQGRRAQRQVSCAIDCLNGIKNLETIVITRGGGSIADLSHFDSQLIAEKIAESSVPILSGIGHEINITITDLAAFAFEKTPTAIAQFLVRRVEDALREMEEDINVIIDAFGEKTSQGRAQLKERAVALHSSTRDFLKIHHEKIFKTQETLHQQLSHQLKSRRLKMETCKDIFLKSVERQFHQAKVKINHYQRLVDLAHPRRTLKRGFSIVRNSQGGLLKTVSQVKPHEEITTTFAHGTIESRVTHIHKEEINGGI